MKRNIVVGIVIIILVIGVSATLFMKGNQGQDESDQIQTLMESTDLTETEAIQFHNLYSDYVPYNQTHLLFANMWGNNSTNALFEEV